MNVFIPYFLFYRGRITFYGKWVLCGCIIICDYTISYMGVDVGPISLYGTDYTHMGAIYLCC